MAISRPHFTQKTTEVSHMYVDETGYHEVRVAIRKPSGFVALPAVVFSFLEWLFG